MTTIPKSNIANNCNIFDLVISTLNLAYREHLGTSKWKLKVKTLEATTFSKMMSAKIILKQKKLEAKI